MRCDESLRMDGSFVKEMSAMSLYNQILAYIEGESSPAHASAYSPEPLVKNDESHSDESQSPREQSPEPLPNDGGDDSPHENASAPLDKDVDNDSPHDEDKNDEDIGPNQNILVTGGKLLSETVDNLTGGGMGKKESVKTPPPVKKDVDPNLFEGGAVLVTEFASAHSTEVDRSEARNVSENGVRGRYTEFLHRLRTPKLFSGGSMKNVDEGVSKDLDPSLVHDSDTVLDGGNIDVLPVFPYLIRY